MRNKTRNFKYGNVGIGSEYRITVQSMTNTDTRDVEATVNQIKALEEAGCDIIRVAVPDMEAAAAILKIKEKINIPLIADIHFDYKLAIESIKNGVDGIRINPGNIGGKEKVKAVVEAAKERNVPIRVGVNSGSIGKEYLERFNGVNQDSMVYSAIEHVKMIEECGYYNIVVALKSSDVRLTVDSYKKISEMIDYPLHLGITEAGTEFSGTIKSSIGIGTLLMMGIGDTIRVSLTGDPIEEVKVGRQILKSAGLLKDGIELISCPTCGRTEIDLISIAKEAEKRLQKIKEPLKIAIMGCVVNGPGEAREADFGIAAGKGEGLIFKKGEIIKKVKEEELLDALLKEIENYIK